MSKKLSDIEGIGNTYAEKLAAAGVKNQEMLLNHGSTSKGRKELAEKAGVSEKMLLEWCNRADLARIKGIGEEYADLLEHAGVDTVPELAQRNAANLHEKVQEINASKRLVRQLPSLNKIEDWVKQAKELPRVITH